MEGNSSSKWVFKKTMYIIVQVKKFKSQLVEKYYSQVEGVDFSDIYFPFLKN
jgi:hypothetical protein